jgi:serine protease Do
MKSRLIAPALLLAALAAPVDAQERRERIQIERDAPRARAMTRAFEIARTPRAVLGIGTAPGEGRQDTLGVRVASVTEGGPAARAGIKEGARLQAIDGVSLRVSAADADDPIVRDLGMRRLTRELGKKNPGDEVELRILSDNQSRTVRVRLADGDSLLRTRIAQAPRAATSLRAAAANRPSLGIQVGSSGSRRDTLGVFVMNAYDDGPAAKAGIVEGARIAAINGVDLRVAAADAEDDLVARSRVQRLMRELGTVKPGDEVELRVWQNGQYRTTRVRTVAADSLRRSRSTFMIGDGMGFDAMPMLPSRLRVPGGPEGGAFQLDMAPHLRDLDIIIQGAMRDAQGAVRAVRVAPAVRGVPPVHRYH